jgi:hypothetical protein
VSLGRYLLMRFITGLLGLLVFASAVWMLAAWLVQGDFTSNWLTYSASKSDWGTLIYWALTTQLFSGGLQWNIIIAAGTAISLLTMGFFLLATGLRRAAEEPPISRPFL